MGAWMMKRKRHSRNGSSFLLVTIINTFLSTDCVWLGGVHISSFLITQTVTDYMSFVQLKSIQCRQWIAGRCPGCRLQPGRIGAVWHYRFHYYYCCHCYYVQTSTESRTVATPNLLLRPLRHAWYAFAWRVWEYEIWGSLTGRTFYCIRQMGRRKACLRYEYGRGSVDWSRARTACRIPRKCTGKASPPYGQAGGAWVWSSPQRPSHTLHIRGPAVRGYEGVSAWLSCLETF